MEKLALGWLMLIHAFIIHKKAMEILGLTAIRLAVQRTLLFHQYFSEEMLTKLTTMHLGILLLLLSLFLKVFNIFEMMHFEKVSLFRQVFQVLLFSSEIMHFKMPNLLQSIFLMVLPGFDGIHFLVTILPL